MRYAWDDKKRVENLKKHGLDFADAHTVIEDPLGAESVYFENGEERTNTIGALGPIIVAVATHTSRTDEGGEVIRIISLRKATSKERRAYEDGIG